MTQQELNGFRGVHIQEGTAETHWTIVERDSLTNDGYTGKEAVWVTLFELTGGQRHVCRHACLAALRFYYTSTS